jgi:hypothetical protein
MPVYLAHGTADNLIPVAESRQLVGRLAGKPDLFYTEIPDGDHDSPLPLVPDSLAWMMKRLDPDRKR